MPGIAPEGSGRPEERGSSDLSPKNAAGRDVIEAWINRIGTAVPRHDMHAAFVSAGRALLTDPRSQAVFTRMAALADIEHRYSIFAPAPPGQPESEGFDAERFYRPGAFPSTADRMARFQEPALELAATAVRAIDLSATERASITHLVVASCTGFSAPGLDFRIMQAAGLPMSVERTLVGFMGCFAAVNALRLAHHTIRSEPRARVLVVNLELCSLHLQEYWELGRMLSFLLFGDGASAALVSREPTGLALRSFRTEIVPDTEDLITWAIGDSGFEMELSGRVPGEIRRFLKADGAGLLKGLGWRDIRSADLPHWAVHAGGRTILDAVQDGLALPAAALRHSRGVLRAFGNMSSATLMFVLARILAERPAPGPGLAMAFGPGLSVESFAFRVG